MIIGRTPKKTRAGVPTSQSLLMGRCYTQGPHTSHSVPYPTRQAHPYDRVARTGGFPEELPPNSASRSTAARKQARCPQLPSNAQQQVGRKGLGHSRDAGGPSPGEFHSSRECKESQLLDPQHSEPETRPCTPSKDAREAGQISHTGNSFQLTRLGPDPQKIPPWGLLASEENVTGRKKERRDP